MNVIKAVLLFPFLLIGMLLSAIWNFVTSAAWLALLLVIIGAVIAAVQSVL